LRVAISIDTLLFIVDVKIPTASNWIGNGHICCATTTATTTTNNWSDTTTAANGGRATTTAKVIKFHEYKGPHRTVQQLQNTTTNNTATTTTTITTTTTDTTSSNGSSSSSSSGSGGGISMHLSSCSPSLTSLTADDVTVGDRHVTPVMTSQVDNRLQPVLDDGVKPTPTGRVQIDGEYQLTQLKVSGLKDQCRRRGLPVSGTKRQLIARLQPFSGHILDSVTQRDNVSVCSKEVRIKQK